jgi:hypothetical protein
MKARHLFAVAALLLPLLSSCGDSGAGPFHRKDMENLVDQVRRQKFDGEKIFAWNAGAGLPTLLPWGSGGQQVFAKRDHSGVLTVVILTAGGGHYGACGFAYSDRPFAPTPDKTGRVALDVPGPMRASFLKLRIDDHWWEVFDDES